MKLAERATRTREPTILLGVVVLAVAVSGIAPRAYGTWLLEVAPVLGGIAVATLTYRRFPLTPIAYRVLTAAALLVALGAHYTYAEVPAGHWVADWFGMERNHYDRLGHLWQGVVAATVLRELLIRLTPLRAGWWLFVLVTLACLGFSGGFELIEALVAVWAGDADYLGTQGDPFDAQWDMLFALTGAVTAQLVLRRAHDRQLTELPEVQAA